MDIVLSFLSLSFISAGLSIDYALLVEFNLSGLCLSRAAHRLWRSVALLAAAAIRLLILFSITQLAFLNNKLPESNLFINRLFSTHPGELTWMHFMQFAGALIIIVMAMWEYYHKFREAGIEECEVAISGSELKRKVSKMAITRSILYLLGMNLIFGVDNVFSAMAVMDIHTQFVWMAASILLAAILVIFLMVPISAIISRNPHFSVLMLTILTVIAAKLLVDGAGGHFSNGLLLFIIAMLVVNDAAQAGLDYRSRQLAEADS